MAGDNMIAALNSARFLLGTAAGIAEPVRGMQVGVAVNVEVKAGYVVDLRDDPDEPLPRPPLIEGERVGERPND
jgi:hypothetical protein